MPVATATGIFLFANPNRESRGFRRFFCSGGLCPPNVDRAVVAAATSMPNHAPSAPL